MNIIQNRTMDEERALYGLHNADVVNCEFSGPLDGESALKECGNINIKKLPVFAALSFVALKRRQYGKFVNDGNLPCCNVV